MGFPVKVEDLGRIAAQSAKQVIIQRMRDAEQEIIYEEYKDRVGEISSGIIQRRDRTGWIINLGRTERSCPRMNRSPENATNAVTACRRTSLMCSRNPAARRSWYPVLTRIT